MINILIFSINIYLTLLLQAALRSILLSLLPHIYHVHSSLAIYPNILELLWQLSQFCVAIILAIITLPSFRVTTFTISLSKADLDCHPQVPCKALKKIVKKIKKKNK